MPDNVASRKNCKLGRQCTWSLPACRCDTQSSCAVAWLVCACLATQHTFVASTSASRGAILTGSSATNLQEARQKHAVSAVHPLHGEAAVNYLMLVMLLQHVVQKALAEQGPYSCAGHLTHNTDGPSAWHLLALCINNLYAASLDLKLPLQVAELGACCADQCGGDGGRQSLELVQQLLLLAQQQLTQLHAQPAYDAVSMCISICLVAKHGACACAALHCLLSG